MKTIKAFSVMFAGIVLHLVSVNAAPPEFTADMVLVSQGTTATPSQVLIQLRKDGRIMTGRPHAIRVQVCNEGTWANSTNATIAAVAGKATVTRTNTATKDIEFASPGITQATGTLTISGVVIDTQTVTVGSRVYEFDTDGNVTAGRVTADISGDATASAGTLTVDTQPTIGDTMTIGTRTYAFVAEAFADTAGEIGIGADLAGAKVNIVAAINGTDGFNPAHPTVTAAAFVGDDCVITAITPGVAGDAIATTETFTEVTNIFDDVTLGTTAAGADCVAADAVTALAAAITGDASAVVTAVDGAGDTVVMTAIALGTSGNGIATTETMANGGFGAGALANGSDAIEHEIRFTVTDAVAETVTLRIGPATLGAFPADYTKTLDLAHAAP